MSQSPKPPIVPGMKSVLNKTSPEGEGSLERKDEEKKPPSNENLPPGLEPVGPAINAYLERVSDDRQKRAEAAKASQRKEGQKVEVPRVSGKLYPKEESDGKDGAPKFNSVKSKWS